MNTSPFTMHSIEARDIGDVIRLADECDLSPWSSNDYLEEAKRSDSTLLRLEDENNSTVGFLVGRRVLSASSKKQYDAEIYNLGVSKSLHRSGCGTMLLTNFLERCVVERVESVWLDVRVSNKSAISFYQKFGFSEFMIRYRFYTGPLEDGMVMKLALSEKRY